MWITLVLVTLGCFSTTQAVFCEHVLAECIKNGDLQWTRCYEETILSCTVKSRFLSENFRHINDLSEEVQMNPTAMHRVQIPSSAIQRSRGTNQSNNVRLVTTVINSTYFKVSKRSRIISDRTSQHHVLGGLVLAVRAGNQTLKNLEEPIKLTFKHNEQVDNGTCVFWVAFSYGGGYWSTHGCNTSQSEADFICSCNHLSFFAVLVNPRLTLDKANSRNLSYITYIGSSLSALFAIISMIIYIFLQRRRPEKAINLHMQLTGALFCLHLSFLLCSFWVWQLKDSEEGLFCRILGLFLHWSLLATLSWTALEGFHLYLLLIRVFNIYVRRYLLKLSLVGWGLPTLTAVICGVLGVYGKYSLNLMDAENPGSEVQICWISSHFQQRLIVSYITTVAFPSLVILCNSCMLGLVVFKLWGIRRAHGKQSSSSWKKMDKEKWSRLWKDCATVLGLSCVLGLPWGLATTTFISLPGIYIFTILNSLQGLFMFLWSMALTCKSQSDNNSSIRDSSSQKILMTSFNK